MRSLATGTSLLRLSALPLMLLAGCSSTTPAAEHPDRTPPATAQTASADPTSDTPNATAGEQCFAECAQKIDAADRLLAQAEALTGAGAAKAALSRKAGEAFVAAWSFCYLTVPNGSDLGCPGARSVVTNMARAFEVSGRGDRLVFAYLVALDPRYREPDGAATLTAERELGTLAAKLEAAVAEDPKHEHAAELLEAAVYARLRRGELERAAENANRYRKSYKAQRPDDVALLAAALASHLNDVNAWARALSFLGADWQSASPKHPRVRVLWHAERARALAGQGRADAAEREIDAVLASYRPDPADQSGSVGTAAPEPLPGRERITDAVGAVLFARAQARRQKAQSLKPPAYKEEPTSSGVEKYLSGALAAWASERQALVEQAAAAYRAVLDVKPVPPPRYVVRAARSAGDLYREYAEAFLDVALPAKLRSEEDVAEAFARAKRRSVEPVVETAAKMYELCLEHAATSGIDNADTAACRAARATDAR